jgi:hypothetical protein
VGLLARVWEGAFARAKAKSPLAESPPSTTLYLVERIVPPI